MRFKKQCPSVEDLHDWFVCDYSTGTLYWKNPRGPKVKPGDPVYLQPQSTGYSRIRLQQDKKQHSFQLHRLIWKMYYREDLGQRELDHIDGDKTNNAITNLRLATASQNQHNRPYAKGFKRNSKYKDKPCSSGQWEVHINIDGKREYMGTEPCPLLARLKYCDLKRQIAKEFSPI